MSDELPGGGESSSGSNEDGPMATRATSDPHNLLRFVAKHGTYFANAMAELRAGHKSSCWSWYLLPTPPFIKDGEEVGSPTNRTYALRTDAEAKAYLAFKHPTVSLRTNYLEMMQLVASKLEEGVNPTRLMGIDVPRLKASAAYLERIARQDDPEVSSACAEVMERLGMPRPAAAPPPAAGQCGMIGTARGCRSYNTDHIDETNLEADVAALLDDPLFESAGTGDYLDQPVAATTIAGESMELETLFPRVPSSVAAVREYNSEDYTRAGYQRMTRMGHVDSMNAVWTHPTSGAAIFVGGRAAAEGPAAALLSKGITHIVNCTGDLDNYCEGEPSLAYLRWHVIEWQFAGDATRVEQATGPEQLRFLARLFDFVQRALSSGGSVLVHCASGMHRAGTTGVLLRMFKSGERAKLATERAQAARPVINPDDLSGPDGTLPRLLRMYEERVIDTDVWGLGPMVEELP